VSEALKKVKMSAHAKSKPRNQRRTAAADRAGPGASNRPQLLLLDEPLSALDANLRRQMQVELKSLQREVGISFIFVTHDQEEAMVMSDRIALLRSGEWSRWRRLAKFTATCHCLRGAVLSDIRIY